MCFQYCVSRFVARIEFLNELIRVIYVIDGHVTTIGWKPILNKIIVCFQS